ncbi:MAG TPA: hypothetical protein ENL02_04250, partial [Epsilonproteobacteria bacterium]|nr:hypothetical protein [Campylobacterota bacterium]
MRSASWRRGDTLEVLTRLYRTTPLFIVQVLPYRLWRGTLLRQASITTLSTSQAYPLNKNYNSEIDYLLKSPVLSDADNLKLPLINLDLSYLKIAGKSLQAKEGNRIDGAVFDIKHYKSDEVSTEHSRLNSQERIERFFANASPGAQELLISLSAVPLNFPIMRMIQEKVLGDTSNIYLAEVLNSNLLLKQSEMYEFVDTDDEEGIRDILLKLLGREKALDILYKNSEYIEDNLNTQFSFKAMLLGDVDLEKIDFEPNDLIFASISCRILKSLGRDYAKRAGCTGTIKTKAIIPHSKRFQMGSDDGRDNEKPVHTVTFNYDFEIAPYLVTFEEYDLFCEDTDRIKPHDVGWGRGRRPVINVSWHDAKAYCDWLSDKTRETYRLPTEAEWEYACRAGTAEKWSFGDDEKELDKYAWYDKNAYDKGEKHPDYGTHPVGTKDPNPWGLYDMHGNVWEWCEDDFVDNYKETPIDGSAYHNQKEGEKVLRGGSW